MMIDHSKMFSDRKWIKCVMFGKWAIRMLSPQLNAQADSIDFQILQNLIIQRMAENQAYSIDFQILQNLILQRMAERGDISPINPDANQQQPQHQPRRGEVQQRQRQPSQQPQARTGLAAINLWGSLPSIPQVTIHHTGNQICRDRNIFHFCKMA